MDPLTNPQTFDLAHWISVFPLNTYRFSGHTVSGPSGVAIIEQIRQKAGGVSGLGPAVPTDVFILGKGESDRRDVTKIGGLPFRPAHAAWPTTLRGEPMTFLAQYRFIDSKDIIGNVPGDILLVFATDNYLNTGGGDMPFFYFEWQPKDIPDLVSRARCPEPAWKFVKCFGVRHRTVDFVDDERALKELEAVVINESLEVLDEFSNLMVYRYNGMKIGGLPLWLNKDDPAIKTIDGRFLASLAEVFPSYGIPFPWINVPEQIPDILERLPEIPGEDVLYWYNGFTANFFIDESGVVRAHSQILT